MAGDKRPQTGRGGTQTKSNSPSGSMAGNPRLVYFLLCYLLLGMLPQSSGTEYSDKVIMNATGYSYDMKAPVGPPMWRDDCLGERQSPINLDDVDSISTVFPPLEWYGHWDNREEGFMMRNTWHSAEVEYMGELPFIKGGPLTAEYILAQVHFHWGTSGNKGSEHSLDTHFFGMEAHLVHYKAEYGSVSAAAGHLDGLVVVGIFFRSSRGNNPELNGIVSKLEEIIEGNNSTRINGDAMEWLEGYSDMQNYYTYLGSLTTPPCSEIVTWIVMKEPAIVGERQIEEFKRLKGHNGTISTNVRPVQELKGRQVFHSWPDSSASAKFQPSSGLILCYLIFTMLLSYK
ncbi:carbonic anhydrase 2-like [Cloeon dipterum]|uniref:carbonic anhydrase 2-like n=1 Tax=Cloeon dipterum TaxID=197152 RepID=UPI0032201110